MILWRRLETETAELVLKGGKVRLRLEALSIVLDSRDLHKVSVLLAEAVLWELIG